MNKYNRGEILEPILILVGLLIVIFLYVIPAGPDSKTGGLFGNNSNRESEEGSFYDNNTNDSSTDSQYEDHIDISSGNASYETEAIDEYITINNYGGSPVTISGWFLTNSKGTKPYTLNGQLQYQPSDQAIIPQGTYYLTPNGQNALAPIILKDGETAIVTSGFIGPRSNIPIVSFKVNKCTGYLEEDAEYNFTPGLRHNCVRPSEEPGFNYLEEECQEYIEGMSYCHIPDFETRDIYGESCRNCVDGKPGLSKSCIAYLKEHFNYAGCLANHGNDPDFLGKEWRVFLGRKWEMWGEKKETITLFDQLGKTIDSFSY
jgi:hypothetical protein